MGDPKEILDGSVLSHRFREILEVPLEFQMELDPHRQSHYQAFPWEIFPAFSQFCFWSQIHLFSVIPSLLGGPNRCYSELQSSTLRVSLAIPDFTRKNLGNMRGFLLARMNLGIFKLSEHSRTPQYNPGKGGNSHPRLLWGVRGCWECFPCGNGGEKGISFTARVGIVSVCVPPKVFNKSLYSRPPLPAFQGNPRGFILGC